MNDIELDELLNSWKAPPVRESWRESVQHRLTRTHTKPVRELLPSWRLLLAGTFMAAIVLLVANASAFSRMLTPPPYTVDSEIRQYLPENVEPENLEDGAKVSPDVGSWFLDPALTLLVTSYNRAGSEVILSASFPNQPLKSVVGKIFLALWDAADMFKRHVMLTPDEEAGAFAVVYPSSPRSDMALVVGRREALLSSGCQTSHGGSTPAGQGTILNYPVTGVQQPLRADGTEMATLWMAPELSCFALRATIHAKQPDGTWKIISEKQALKVTVNVEGR